MNVTPDAIFEAASRLEALESMHAAAALGLVDLAGADLAEVKLLQSVARWLEVEVGERALVGMSS